MARTSLQRFKQLLTVVGRSFRPSALHRLRISLNYMELGRWMKDKGFSGACFGADQTVVATTRLRTTSCVLRMLFLRLRISRLTQYFQ